MLTRLIAMLLLFSFGFSAMGECCVVCDDDHHEESSQSDGTYRSYTSYRTYMSHDDDHHRTEQQPVQDCDDNCAACLHTALSPSTQQTAVVEEQTISYPASQASALLSRTASIDRPPCWIA